MKCLRYLGTLLLVFVLVKPAYADRIFAEDVIIIDSEGQSVTLQA